MKNTYTHSEMVNIVKEFFDCHTYPVVTVQDANDPSYSDTIEKAAFNMFKRDYEGSEYVTYFKQPCEIVVVLA